MPNQEYAERLPAHINPCPILDVFAEVRFQTQIPSSVLPGLVYGAVRERFPRAKVVDQGAIPDVVRSQNAALRYRPSVVFHGEDFDLHVGPQVLFLATSRSKYPGWVNVRSAMEWVLDRFEQLNCIDVPERLGLRYLDFFELPVAEKLQFDLRLADDGLTELPLHLKFQLRVEEFGCLVQINTSSVLTIQNKRRTGAILDIDVTASIPAERFFQKALEGFDNAHDIQKSLFFKKMLNPKYLKCLNPEYD